MRAKAVSTSPPLKKNAFPAALLLVFTVLAGGCVHDFNSFLGSFGGGGGQNAAASEPLGVAVLVTDPDPNGTNVRDTPGGKIIKVIPYGGKTDAEISLRRVLVTEQHKEWFQVRLADGSSGWMHRSVLGARAGEGGPALYAQPESGSARTATVKDGAALTLLAVQGNWAKVEYAGTAGKKTTGWMTAESLSADPRAATPPKSVAPKTPPAQPAAQKPATAPKTEPKKAATAPKAEPKKTATAPKTATPEKDTKKTTPAKVSGKTLAAAVQKHLGVKYVWGGTTPKGFDCSGLMFYVCQQYKVTIPRTSSAQAKAGKAVAKKDLKPGDLVFFGPKASGPVDHVGMYIGNDTYVHAPNPELPVMKTKLSDNSFVQNGQRRVFMGKYVTGRRIVD